MIILVIVLFLIQTYAVGTQKKRICEAILMSTHNICFMEKLKKKNIPKLSSNTPP